MDAGIAKNNNNTMGKQNGLGYTRLTVSDDVNLKNKPITIMVGGKRLDEILEEMEAAINRNTTKVDGKCDLSVIAPEYSSDVTYDEGDVVTHEGKLYACTKETTGDWDDKSWNETTITEII
jgi:hypothetical protein